MWTRVLAGAGALLGASLAQAQPVVGLGRPQVAYGQEFSLVAGVREQSDGALVVVDQREMRIWRVPSPTAAPVALGRQGMGPGEFQAPIRLAALPGDTTIVLDAFSDGRVHVVTRDGMAKAALAVRGRTGRALVQHYDVGTDAMGNLYERAAIVRLAPGGQTMRSDSLGVRRVSRVTGRVDTVGRYYGLVRSPLLPRRSASGAPNEDVARAGGPMPFATHDMWAVAADGRLAFVSAEPYQVRFRLEDGRTVMGPVIRHTPVPVNSALKAAWRAAESAPVLSLVTDGRGNQSVGYRPRRAPEPARWPDVLPPFGMDATVRFAPDGMLWVERLMAAGAPVRFDVIDPAGAVVRQVELPPRARLVGFGARTVYLARLDDDDIERIERYARP